MLELIALLPMELILDIYPCRTLCMETLDWGWQSVLTCLQMCGQWF